MLIVFISLVALAASYMVIAASVDHCRRRARMTPAERNRYDRDNDEDMRIW